ncbi:EAL and HDOD domain-containing protein [Pseudodesulfovibrio sp.]|uniref:EAL and HDOD domain-containing protein n=1 Tax=unclassified Pseudodesulfovibrio TaxID=2661612 RepID=UPI003B00B74E
MMCDADDPVEMTGQAVIVRQPIFTRDKDIWGYELLSSGSVEHDVASELTLSEVVRDYRNYISSLPSPIAGKKILMRVSDSLRVTADDAICGEECAFWFDPKMVDHPGYESLVQELSRDGGTLVMEDSLDPSRADLFRGGVIIRVSLAEKTPPEIVNIRNKFKGIDCDFLAVDVDSWEAFEGSRALGFSYFQGPFFSLPETETATSLPANSVSKLKLLRELGNPDCEVNVLADIISSDISLSYRILKYMNSASLGIRNKITSIAQAVSLLGLNEVRHWSMVVVMTDLDSTPRGEELSYLALQRGRFLNKLAESMPNLELDPDTMFLLGLFSKLDALLSCPMEQALKHILLDDRIKDALCGRLNEFRDWLLLLQAVEIGHWKEANEILVRYGACLTRTATQYMQASSWAAKLLPELTH